MINLRTGQVRAGQQPVNPGRQNQDETDSERNRKNGQGSCSRCADDGDNIFSAGKKVSASWKAEWNESEFARKGDINPVQKQLEISAKLVSITQKVNNTLSHQCQKSLSHFQHSFSACADIKQVRDQRKIPP